MRLVIVESPWRGDTEHNFLYGIACLRDSICRGESPYASHLYLTLALDDTNAEERDLGIRCGYAWWRAASLIAFYTDLGWSQGMIAAHYRARSYGIRVEERSIEGHLYRVDAT